MAVLIVDVDDTLSIRNDEEEIKNLREGLAQQFEIKSFGIFKYFLGIEVAYSKEGIFISQHKYILDLMKETSMLDCNPASTHVDINVKVGKGEESPLVDKVSFQRLFGWLIYLNHGWLDISFAVSYLSQFMSDPHENHLQAARQVLSYLKAKVSCSHRIRIFL